MVGQSCPREVKGWFFFVPRYPRVPYVCSGGDGARRGL